MTEAMITSLVVRTLSPNLYVETAEKDGINPKSPPASILVLRYEK
jgi:hypothetical protein